MSPGKSRGMMDVNMVHVDRNIHVGLDYCCVSVGSNFDIVRYNVCPIRNCEHCWLWYQETKQLWLKIRKSNFQDNFQLISKKKYIVGTFENYGQLWWGCCLQCLRQVMEGGHAIISSGCFLTVIHFSHILLSLCLFPVVFYFFLSLFSISSGDDTKWPRRVYVMKLQHIKNLLEIPTTEIRERLKK